MRHAGIFARSRTRNTDMKTTIIACIMTTALAGCLSDEADSESPDLGSTAQAVTDPNSIVFGLYGSTTLCLGKNPGAKLSLSIDPLASTPITVSSNSPNVVVGPPTSFMFNSSNWGTIQVVPLNGKIGTYSPVTLTASSPGYTSKTLQVTVSRIRCL